MDYISIWLQIIIESSKTGILFKILSGVVIVFVVSFAVQVFYYLYFYLRIFFPDKIIEHKHKPSISVIIAARNEAENLQKNLIHILNQKYANFEVIVVNDASEDESTEVLEKFKREFSNFYYTNIPYDNYFSHGKKLAVLVGYKAAKNEWLVFTDADCYPKSENWLSELAKGMDENAEVVLAYGAHTKRKGLFNKIIRYDTMSIAMQYLSFAHAGIPYMGVGRNMAVKKSAFKKLKKYRNHIHVLSGADDLIINELANKKNTRIITSKDSFTYSAPQKNFARWFLQKSRHISSSGYYKWWHKILLLLEPLSRALFYLSFIILAVGNFELKFVAILFIIRFLFQTIVGIKANYKFKTKDLLMIWFLFDTFVFVIIGLISVISMFRRQKIRWK